MREELGIKDPTLGTLQQIHKEQIFICTSALSWMSILSHMQLTHIVNFCHLLSHIIFYFNTVSPSRFDGQHIAVF